MSRIKKLLEQHREKGRFKPVLPRIVLNNPGVSPRDEFSQNVRTKRKMRYDIHREESEMKEEKKMKSPDPCWKGYEMIGKKMKNGRQVPNCVPVKKENISESDLPIQKVKPQDVVTVRHKTSERELRISKHAIPKYKEMGYEVVKEQVDENRMEVPISVRSLYAKTYGKHAKTIRHSQEAKQKAYDEVEKRHGTDMMKKLKGYHDKNVQESKTASIARGILMRKMETMKSLKTPLPPRPKEPEKPTTSTVKTEEVITEKLSRKAEIVRDAVKKVKGKKDTFQQDPVITQTYVKTENS